MWGEAWVCVGGDWEFEVRGGTDCCMGDKQPGSILIKDQLNKVLTMALKFGSSKCVHTHTHTHQPILFNTGIVLCNEHQNWTKTLSECTSQLAQVKRG